ncbi:MAG: M50 family metallopeptidase [Patescibacteria group bacterium UBA2103]
MGVLLFIVVLVALIVVHEFGHFIAAKISKMRVDEFGLGYPPKLFGKKIGETEYTLNALPFGGFVKIHGEDMDMVEEDHARAFASRPRILQAFVLIAGVAMNVLVAWILLVGVLASGAPRALTPEQVPLAENVALTVTYVVPGTPADEAGLSAGDVLTNGVYGEVSFSGTDVDSFVSFVGGAVGEEVSLTFLRNGEEQMISIVPEEGIVEGQGAVGVGLAQIGEISVPLQQTFVESFVVTGTLLKDITIGIVTFLYQAFTFSADFSQVAGPVGIAGVVADAGENGIIPLLSLTALISLNLAVINMLPVPALDGGRLLFVAIESIIRRPLPKQFAQTANAIGFLLLILLMIVVTVSDIGKLLG